MKDTILKTEGLRFSYQEETLFILITEMLFIALFKR